MKKMRRVWAVLLALIMLFSQYGSVYAESMNDGVSVVQTAQDQTVLPADRFFRMQPNHKRRYNIDQ